MKHQLPVALRHDELCPGRVVYLANEDSRDTEEEALAEGNSAVVILIRGNPGVLWYAFVTDDFLLEKKTDDGCTFWGIYAYKVDEDDEFYATQEEADLAGVLKEYEYAEMRLGLSKLACEAALQRMPKDLLRD